MHAFTSKETLMTFAAKVQWADYEISTLFTKINLKLEMETEKLLPVIFPPRCGPNPLSYFS